MPTELIILVLGLLPIVLRMWVGWNSGATREIRYTLVYLFALLAAMRYWHATTELVKNHAPFDPQIVAALVFAIIFLAFGFLAALAVNLRGTFYQSVLPNPTDQVLGAMLGAVSGALLGGAFVMVCAFTLSGKLDGFDASKIPGHYDQIPVQLFQMAESQIAGIPQDSLSSTVFPQPAALRSP